MQEKNRHQDNVPITTAIGHHRAIALNGLNGGIKICEKHQTFEVIG